MAIAEGATIEAPKALEWGEVWGRVSPPQSTRESGEHCQLPPAPPPPPKTHFGIYLGHRTLLVDRKMRFFAQCNVHN